MHYYQHHIGDFIRDTSNLTDSQSMTYLRLIWTYYDTEQPIEDAVKKLAFKLGSDAETVELLLETFFKKEADGWHHKRIDAEISAYQTKGEKARENANARWSNSRRNADAMQTQCDGIADAMPLQDSSSKVDANQQPITNNQEPVNTNTPLPPKGSASGFEEFWKTYPNKSAKVEAQKSFNKIKPDHALLAKIISAVEAFKKSAKWTKDGGAYIPHAATWLNGKRWEDEVQSGGYAEPVRRQARQVYQ
jgi:uncharacterized protein YdaU (DUF1376 family)